MKKPIIISVLCVALTIVLLLWGFRQSETAQPKAAESYALVIANDTGSFVMQLRKGLQQAANESGATLAVCTLAEAAKMTGLSGAILWLDDPAEALNRLSGVPVVVVGQSLDGVPCVLGDDQSGGEQLLEHALALCPAKAILLICDDEDEHALRRSAAARALAAQRGVDAAPYGEPLPLSSKYLTAVALSPRATRALIAMKREGLFSGLALGVDTGDDRVENLESGMMTAMALDSPYAMGYIAFQKARALHEGGPAESAVTRVLLATQSNMYLSENVKQVFPLLQ